MLSVVFGAITVVTPAFAATSTTSATGNGAGNGMKISPVESELTLNPGQTSTVDVYLTNVTSEVTTFQAIVNDFEASSDESGNPAIILNPNQSAPSHGLKQYVAPIGNVTLNPGQTADVKAVINLPQNIAPGGYFGAIRFAPASDNASKNISLSASVASLILVRVSGKVTEQVTISSFNATSKGNQRSVFTSKKSIDATVRFQNEGNVQEQPFGKILVENTHGKVISSVSVNDTTPRGNVLPNSIRRFDVPLTGLSSFGKYKIEGNFGYGSDGQLLSATSTFYVIPISIIVILLVIVAILIAAIFEVPRLIKRYNKRVLRKAGQ
jgi:hypothetical protein